MQSQTNGIRNLIMREYWDQFILLPSMQQQRQLAETISDRRQQAKLTQQEAQQDFAKAKQAIEQLILNG